MKFNNFQDLINKINRGLGDFCNRFQYTRIRLNGKEKVPRLNELFHYNHKYDWAINQGGGTEIQYHINEGMKYGLGFSSQFVRFKYDLSPVDYIKHFVESYLEQPELEEKLLDEGFSYLFNKNDLKNLTEGNYFLIGKIIKYKKENDQYEIEDNDFEKMLEDLKGVMFDSYKKIFEGRNKIIENKNGKLLERRKKAIPRGIGSVAFDKFMASANNDIITDENGKQYIDFASGIAVNNTGHANPRINEVVKKQMDKFVHSSFQVMPYEPYIEVCEKINEISPINDKNRKTILFNSGAEAIENAIKIAKSQQNREAIVSFVGGFHGRTTLSMSLTGKIKPYKEDFGLPYPYSYHIPFPIDFHHMSTEYSKKCLEFLFKSTINPEKVAAILIEPIMGEGGFYILPKDFAIYLREICDKYKIVLIFDEVQTGFARTGKMFATEYFDVKPDMITMAKGIAGGYILSAVVGKSEMMDKPSVGGLGGTYAGSPISCVASLEVIKIIEEENLAQRSYELGVLIREKLNEIKSDFVANVRGLGCMNAFEFVDKNRQPDPSKVSVLISECKENGLIVLSCGLFGNSIRILNPLTIKKENLFKGLAIMKDRIEKLK